MFTIIEEHIAQYKDLGDIIAIGDFNSRVGTQLDFIVHDILDKSYLHLLSNVITYASDIDFTRRNSEDKTVNQFGRKLLSLCKSSGLRIVNGRHTGDKNGSITFYNANGSSLIDYVLVHESCYQSIEQFQSGKFNCFSDHAPVCFSASFTKLNNIAKEITNEQTHTSTKWNDEYNNEIVDKLVENVDNLINICTVNCNSQETVNRCVDA